MPTQTMGSSPKPLAAQVAAGRRLVLARRVRLISPICSSMPRLRRDLASTARALSCPALGDQVARRLGDRQRHQPVERGPGSTPMRNIHRHASQPEPQLLPRAAGDAGEEAVRRAGRRRCRARWRAAAASPAGRGMRGRRDLGDVGRGDDRGGADRRDRRRPARTMRSQAAKASADAERTDGEQHRGEHHDPDPAEAVGEPARRTRRRPRSRAGPRTTAKPSHDRRPVELVLDGVDRAVDHRGVEAEQEPAERRNRGQEQRTTGVVLLLCLRLVHCHLRTSAQAGPGAIQHRGD